MAHPNYVNIGTPAMRIIEECGEILQAVGKGERFGWRNHHPDTPNTDNLLALENEICVERGTLFSNLVDKVYS